MQKSTNILMLLAVVQFSFAMQSVNKKHIYNAMASDSKQQVDQILTSLENEKQSAMVLAYKGTLLTKKAEFVAKVPEKVQLCKKGIGLLETELKKDPNNMELHFLRLTIQEHAPKIIKYHSNIEEDKAIIKKGYLTANAQLKQIILNYSKSSKLLTPEDLQ